MVDMLCYTARQFWYFQPSWNRKIFKSIICRLINFYIKTNAHLELAATVCRCSLKWVFLKFGNIHRKTTVFDSLFDKAGELQACNFIKKRLQHWCFPGNIAKCLRIALLTEYFRWLLLWNMLSWINLLGESILTWNCDLWSVNLNIEMRSAEAKKNNGT